MRLSLIPWTCGLVALLAVPASGQPRLTARTFQPVKPPEPAPAVEWWRNGGPRIRPADQRTTTLLQNGLERSARLRALVDAVDAAHVVVYLGLDPRMETGLAGRLTFMGNAGRYRYVQVSINPRLSGDVMIASLAHELQHVAEVIDHPDVTSEQGLRKLYERIGRSTRAGGTRGWETNAAQEITHEVRRELAEGPVASVARQEPPKVPAREDEHPQERF